MTLLRSAFVVLLVVQPILAGDDTAAFESSLFDGKTLNGWTIENDCEAAVQDGMLLLKSGDGWLRSDHEYADFVLHVEWKALKAGKYDAGIYIRTKNGGGPYPKNGHQINLLHDREGDLVGNRDATSDGLVKVGDWNAFDITVKGDTVSNVINGKPAWSVSGLKNRTGHVGFQIEVPLGGQFLVRNVTIKELGYEPLFNGTDLTGWEGGGKPADVCWKADEGTVMCTGEKGPWLRSKQEYGDFNFRFEYLVSPGGNSGIYVRVPENGNHHRDDDSKSPAGFEIQVLDDRAEKYAKLKPYQYCGSLYDICGASEHVGRAAGEWNTLEIDCAGQTIRTMHNGIEIVHVTPESHPLISLRKVKGFLGLQNHSTIVRFRNLRVGPALPVSESAE